MAKLVKAKVVLDPQRRRDIILHDAKNLAFAQGYELVEDAGLLAEVAGLVDWPVALMGAFDEAFLSIPPEVIRTTIRANQKCFVLRDPQTAKLVPKFILVANTEAVDGGAAITAGNERVIRARLSDAKFFYETDFKTRLEDRLRSSMRSSFTRSSAPRRNALSALSDWPPSSPRSWARTSGQARRAPVQGRPAHRGGRRIPRAARADGEISGRGAGRGGGRRPCV